MEYVSYTDEKISSVKLLNLVVCRIIKASLSKKELMCLIFFYVNELEKNIIIFYLMLLEKTFQNLFFMDYKKINWQVKQ